MNGPTYDNCLFAAKNVLNALEQIGEPWACLVGGMAARLYGVRRETRVSRSRLQFLRFVLFTRIKLRTGS